MQDLTLLPHKMGIRKDFLLGDGKWEEAKGNSLRI
jgi:hypothetical protein